MLVFLGGKCWFFEVCDFYLYYDVEYFCLKKEVKVLDGIECDGYWWLVFDYMNFWVCGNVGNCKKGGWFFLQQGLLCLMFDVCCEEFEVVYLLDLIDDDDVFFVVFDEEGKFILMLGSLFWEQECVIEIVKCLKFNEYVVLVEVCCSVWQKVDVLIEDFLVVKVKCVGGKNLVVKVKFLEV